MIPSVLSTQWFPGTESTGDTPQGALLECLTHRAPLRETEMSSTPRTSCVDDGATDVTRKGPRSDPSEQNGNGIVFVIKSQNHQVGHWLEFLYKEHQPRLNVASGLSPGSL